MPSGLSNERHVFKNWRELSGYSSGRGRYLFVATLINLVLSRRAAFLSVRRLRAEVMLVFAMSAIAFASNFLCFVALYRYAGVNILAAKVSDTFVGFGFNYLVRQFFIFSPVPLHKPVLVVLRPRRRSEQDEITSVRNWVYPRRVT